jgi:hypothetical protein
MPKFRELRVLADYINIAGLAANTWDRPSPTTVNGEIDLNERAEIVYAEVWSPVTGIGVEEALKKIILVLDGTEYGHYISLSGIRATNMAPPKNLIFNRQLYAFGVPGSNNPMKNTTPKFKQNVSINVLAGATPITQPYRIRLWGIVYKTDELPQVFGTMKFTNPLVNDQYSRRQINVTKADIAVTGDTWLLLPGGKDQQIPKINPFVRYAYNLAATDGQQGDYLFRYDRNLVLDADENMYFNFQLTDALIIEALGIKAAGTLAKVGLWIDGIYHPSGPNDRQALYPVTLNNNDLNFGHLYPVAPVDHPYYSLVPRLPQPYLIWNEIGSVVARDDGSAVIVANAIVAAIAGIRIEMTS